MALNLLQRTETRRGLFPIEVVSLAYGALTTVLILFLHERMDHPLTMVLERIGIAVITVLLLLIYQRYSCKLTSFLRTLFQLGLLAYWYPDTYEFNRLFPNLDHLFAHSEQVLFGCQPAIEFSRLLPSVGWSEAFNLGYFSYYPMIAAVVLFYFIARYREFDRTAFVVLTSFFIYYLIYIFVPVAGPQYYFPAIGLDEVALGHFRAVGDYFNHHSELLPAPGDAHGFFYGLVEMSQQAGERPTAAFPSSHVGMSTILMLLALRTRNRVLPLVLLPFYVLLCCATVYIQAHYLIDALCGFVSAFVVYALAVSAYRFFLLRGASLREVKVES